MRRAWLSVTFSLAAGAALSSGGPEGAAASDRGKAVAESGRVIPPAEVPVDSHIAEIDHGYPDPIGDLGISLLAGHRQVSRLGEDELIVIGLQGRRGGMDALPPLNLVLVPGASGSMSGGTKRELAVECLRVLLSTLRGCDLLSIVSWRRSRRCCSPRPFVRSSTPRA